MRTALYTIFAILTVCSNAYAEDINITADKQVEWHQNESKMVAVGNALAVKKDLSIKADTLTAFYSKDSNKTNISKINAKGNVIMKSAQATAYGNNMDYSIKEDFAVLTGSPAKIKTEKETISATESITYYPSKQKAIALGTVIVDDGENKVYSNKLISYFQNSPKGSLEIDKVEIFDNVKIVTKDAVVTGNRGTYFPKTGKIKLFENIIITQDGNVLKGSEAESDLNSGITRLISGKSGNGRVSGVFKEKPKQEKKND